MSDAARRPPIGPDDRLLAHGRQRVGEKPHYVQVFVHAGRGGVLYLRWRAGGTWAYESLGVALPPEAPPGARKTAREAADRARKEAAAAAVRRALAKYAALAGGAAGSGGGAGSGGAGAEPPPDPAAEAERARLAAQAAFPVGAARARVTEPGAGRFAADTPYARDVLAGWDRAVAVWGAGTRVAALRRDDWVRLWRREFTRIRQGDPADGKRRPGAHAGFAGARATVERAHRVLDALKAADAIAEEAAPRPRDWQKALARDFAELHGQGETPERHRPRFTADELRALHRAARRPATDPRVRLAMALGAELRPAQVLRLTRRSLTLPTPATAADYGRCVVKGRGSKGGVTLDLTRQQRAEVDAALHPETGYLRDLEAACGAGAFDDYLLFQAGRLATGAAQPPADAAPTPRPARYLTVARDGATRPRRVAGTCPPVLPLACATTGATAGRGMSDTTLRTQFLAVQVAAGITPARRRAWYGQRRGTVDAADARNVSAGTLQQLGGWTNPETPLGIYKDRESAADRRAARDARAAIRGEDDAPHDPQDAAAPPGAPGSPDSPAAPRGSGRGKRRQDVDTAAGATDAPRGSDDNPSPTNDL